MLSFVILLGSGARAVLANDLQHGTWQQPNHAASYGNAFNSTKAFRWPTSRGLRERLRRTRRGDLDVYQFGVYTGGSMRNISRTIGQFRRMWGFDSFQGLPTEQDGLHTEGQHWSKGAFSAADALGVWNARMLMDKIFNKIGHPNVTLILGFFNESLPNMHLAHLRPALLVDVDGDLYLSAKDCLTWLFKSNLIVPGTLLRYDDWHVIHQPTWGEMKAHDEITKEFNVVWKTVEWPNEFEVVSIGDDKPVSSHSFRSSRPRPASNPFNHSLAALSKLATPHPPVFDRQLQLDSEATPQQARRARSAQAKLMRGWSCERDVNAPVPCLPSSLASESPFLKKYCPKFDKAIHECAQLCEEHPQCVVFLHNLYGHCYLRTARGVVTAETSPSHGTMLCRRSGVTAPQEPQGESEEAMPTQQRRHDRLGMDWEYQPHLTNSK